MNPFVLGITGGIGSGKSCVSRLLASYCLVPLIDVDQCCRHLLDINQPGWLALRSEFEEALFLENGAVDRVALRERIFNNAEIRRQVDALLHPLAREAMREQLGLQQVPLILVEIPLLYEAGWQGEVDAVLVVFARRGAQCCRIMRRDGVSRRAAAQAIAAQMSLKEKANRAEYVIDNSWTWASTRAQVVSLGNELSERFAD
ncbi:dephospho-CoA kinase [uncultured Desulfobulbus sp.]|uniref:dephospho-CoA kinase n=1 Tax=uncultured Desulfobulbus sp. TaxID=239745 RepID=UPI0029C7BF45|nr:dephospho-CoA kinase [uncultured Desulfobulbus sp.]